MHTTIIKTLKPKFISKGKPTAIVRKLNETEAGRQLVKAIFAYYADNVSSRIDTSGWVLNTDIDIDNYRWDTGEHFVNRLRRAGL